MAVSSGIVITLNVITTYHNEPEFGLAAPIVWEGSAWIALMVAVLIPWALTKYLPPERPPIWRTVLFYVAAAPLFSAVHVTLFVLIRMLVYWAAGSRYMFGPIVQNFEYEASKDVFGYAGALASFWGIRWVRKERRSAGARERQFDIRDGATLIRVKMDDILAVTSAGNYVEFALRDGRRPLMRKPLSAMEAELAAYGFVRVHRSWLVNAMQVTGLKPEGSGDYTVDMGALSVPLSRRFPEALAKLRAG